MWLLWKSYSWNVFSVYDSPMFEVWKVPKRPVAVLCDVTQHLVVYRTAVGTPTISSGMRAYTGKHSQFYCMHTIFCWKSYVKRTKIYRTWRRYSALALYKVNFASASFRLFSLPNLPNMFGNYFSRCALTAGRLISDSKIWWEFKRIIVRNDNNYDSW